MTHPAIASKFELIKCCTPRRAPMPSGFTWVHAQKCPEFHGAKLKDTHPHLFKRPAPELAPNTPHEACRLSYADGGTPCWRCAPILHEPDCVCDPCRYTSEHQDDVPDWGRV